jgi:hypothetical protein
MVVCACVGVVASQSHQINHKQTQKEITINSFFVVRFFIVLFITIKRGRHLI